MVFRCLKIQSRVIALAAGLVIAAIASGQVSVLTQRNDAFRTGVNPSETSLTATNISADTFGKLFAWPVDGQIYAQPLVVPNLFIAGVRHNVVFVPTMHDSVYAFDTDNPRVTAPLWKTSFTDPAHGITSVPYLDVSRAQDAHPEIGIVSTPVIDFQPNLGTGTIFVTAKTKEVVAGVPNYVYRLHALDILTGHERPGSPTLIAGSVPGWGDGNVNGVVSFDALREMQRPALLLQNGNIYAAFASHGDTSPYHGWIFSFDAKTFKQNAMFCTSANGGLTGIWMSGGGLSTDGNGNVLAITGNGTYDQPTGSYSNTLLKLDPSLNLTDYFATSNQDYLNYYDLDLGVCAPMVIPSLNYVVHGGKEGKLYVESLSNLGKQGASDDNQIVEWWWATNGHTHGMPIYWQGPNGNFLFSWGEYDYLKAFQYVGGAQPFNQWSSYNSAMTDGNGEPGGFLSLSSNGNSNGSAVLWANMPASGDANWYTSPGIVRAFDPRNLQELWNSEMIPTRDHLGNFSKFAYPTVANGRVYLGTFGNDDGSTPSQLVVYGLLPAATQPPGRTVGLTATAGDSAIWLGWPATSGAAWYNIKRSTQPSSGFTTIKTKFRATSFVDTGLTNGTHYFYKVSAQNTFAEGQDSNIASAVPIGGTLVVLNDVADSYIRSGQYSLYNYSTSTELWTKLQGTDEARTYVKFDLSSITDSISSALLRLTGGHVGDTVTSMVSAWSVRDTTWIEQGLNYRSAPPLGSSLSSSVVPLTARSLYWDVTSFLKSNQASGATKASLALRENLASTAPGHNVFLSRRSAGPSPQLQLLVNNAPSFPNGFGSASNFTFNGNAVLNGSRLRLTDGQNWEGGSIYWNKAVDVTGFHTYFTFQITNPQADGFTFLVQRSGLHALGTLGGGLGYGSYNVGGTEGVLNSVAIKFDLWDNSGEGVNSTGMFVNGTPPTVPAIDLSSTGIDLHSGHVFQAAVSYVGSTLTVTLLDTTTGATATQTYSVDIPGTIGGSTAYVGFTGATGGLPATQEILSWAFGH